MIKFKIRGDEMHITVGKQKWQGRVVQVECRKNAELEYIDNKGQYFLMVILLSGRLSFNIDGHHILAEAPCFLCFDEMENPEFDFVEEAEYFRIYFHPVFLNVNMTFHFIRSKQYDDLAQAHDLFLLKPFLEHQYVVPIGVDFFEKVRLACENLEKETKEQPDWYWSCRSRSYFMEIMIALERMASFFQEEIRGEEFYIQKGKLQDVLSYMEGHYNEPVTLKDITEKCGMNHTTLTTLMKQQTGMTVMEYLTNYRLKVAKKHLAFTEIPLNEIADRCGFKTSQHFSRVFKEKTGQTPISFRQTALEKRKKELNRKQNGN